MGRNSVVPEKKRLNKMGKVFFTEKAMTIDKEQMLMVVREAIDYVRGPRALEMGYTGRGWTDALLQKKIHLTVMEGSVENIRHAREKYGDSLDVRHMLFEELDSQEEYDTVLMSCILEHVQDPVCVLKKVRRSLKKDGTVVIIVPNKMSLHRRIGYHMKMIKSFDELAPQDIEVGHRRHYDTESMLQDMCRAGFDGRFEKGIFLKPLSSDKMMTWPREMLWAFNEVGRYLPEWSAFLLFTASKK